MESWLEQLITWLPTGALYYFLLGLIAFLESLAIVGLFIPGSVVIVLAGFLAAQGKGDPYVLMSVAALGSLAGDMLSYWLGARHGARKSFIAHGNFLSNMAVKVFFSVGLSGF